VGIAGGRVDGEQRAIGTAPHSSAVAYSLCLLQAGGKNR